MRNLLSQRALRCPNISICVVARNGERTYKRLFDSLREFADRFGDMVLVDTGSSDDTRAIYKAFGFRVFAEGDRLQIKIPSEIIAEINRESIEVGDTPILEEGASLFNFAYARNYAASLALNDYIINPDADETLTVFNIDKVEEFFGKFSRFQYEFVYNHNEDGSPDLQFITDTRASDRRYWRWAGFVHEINTPISAQATMGYVPPDVLKIDHWQVPSPTRSNYLSALAYACHVDPKNDRNLHYYGRELMYKEHYRLAIHKLQQHIDLNCWDEERAQSAIFIGDCYLRMGEDSKALLWYNKSFEMFGKSREPLMRLAEYWYRKGSFSTSLDGELHRSIAYCTAALELPHTGFYGYTPRYFRELPHEILYWAYYWIGNKEKSRIHWEKALQYQPRNPKFLAAAQFYV